MQRHFLNYHLLSAAQNARIAGKAEEVLESIGQDRFEQEFQNNDNNYHHWQSLHDAHVATPLISSFASIEAGANEQFTKPELGITSEPASHAKNYPGDLLRETETLDKIQLILSLTGNGEFNAGKQPYQDVEILRKFRNHLVHHEYSTPQKLLGGLRTKDIDESPFASGGGVDNYLSYDGAKWSFDDTQFSKRIL